MELEFKPKSIHLVPEAPVTCTLGKDINYITAPEISNTEGKVFKGTENSSLYRLDNLDNQIPS